MIPYVILAGALAGLFLMLAAIRRMYDRRWDRGLGVTLAFRDRTAVEGSTTALREVIVNDKRLPLPAVDIDFQLDRNLRFADGQNVSVSDKTYRRDIFALNGRQKITRTLTLECLGRGYYEIDRVGLTGWDLFLRKKYRDSQPQHAALYVTPRPVPTRQVQLPYARITGELLTRRRELEDPFAFAGLREYARGDPLKYVNWKATARAGELLTNLHDSTLSQRVTLLLDVDTAALYHGELLVEEGIRLACALAQQLLQEGVTVELISNGIDCQTGEPWLLADLTGGGSVPGLLRKFACLQGGEELPDVLSGWESTGDLTVLISPREELAKPFAARLGRERGLFLLVGEGPAKEEKRGSMNLIRWEASL